MATLTVTKSKQTLDPFDNKTPREVAISFAKQRRGTVSAIRGEDESKKEKPQKSEKKKDNFDIPIKDKILLGPIDKYRKYNRFPWKFLLHNLMLIMTTGQVLLICMENSNYAFNARKLWNNLFMTTPGGETVEVGDYVWIYDVPTLVDFVNNTVQNYYQLNSDNMFDNMTQAVN